MNREILNKIREINNKKTQKQKACVVTFGCQQNESDSEKIKGMLEAMGYEITESDITADSGGGAKAKDGAAFELENCGVVIINTCAIREHAELKAFSRTGQLKRYKDKNKDMLIGMCGCMVEQEHILEYIEKSFKYVDFVFGTRSIHKFPEILHNALLNLRQNNTEITETDIANITEIEEDMPAKRGSLFKAWVPVMYGCDNFCSYCVVPHVRGRERSRKKDKILDEVRTLAANGYKDITLLGQNVNSYKDPGNKNYDFTELLRDVTEIEGDYWLRFITSHPKDISGNLIKLMGESKNIANHLHLPLQSGNNRILKLMNRKYTREDYLDLVEKLKDSIKDIAVTSDIIVGFPSETEEEFEETLDLIKRAGFDNIFPFIYSKRKNTPAEKMEDNISHKEKTDRFAELIKIQREISAEKNKAYEGKTVRVLAEGEYKNDKNKKNNGNYLSGRTSSNKLTVFEYNGNVDLTGSFVNVKIKEGRLHGLFGELE
ncbi:MAG: tRNA (N6-isopentenyl adenosine(37)-C2)-methylthiotransferase MiaB [Oscillospiraceae bacterium]|nr:tRNA (N6-isopentenyl adenosine(37)-C2)-methylthiotransferase MiaB [Oscillospiraceae bacterium]